MFVIVVFVVEMTVGTLGFLYHDEVTDVVRFEMYKSIVNSNGGQNATVPYGAWDRLQQQVNKIVIVYFLSVAISVRVLWSGWLRRLVQPLSRAKGLGAGQLLHRPRGRRRLWEECETRNLVSEGSGKQHIVVEGSSVKYIQSVLAGLLPSIQ